jgi:hypothetical protein
MRSIGNAFREIGLMYPEGLQMALQRSKGWTASALKNRRLLRGQNAKVVLDPQQSDRAL